MERLVMCAGADRQIHAIICQSGADLEFLDDEETVLQTLRRPYADPSAWPVRANRGARARPIAGAGAAGIPRASALARQPHQPRPQ